VLTLSLQPARERAITTSRRPNRLCKIRTLEMRPAAETMKQPLTVGGADGADAPRSCTRAIETDGKELNESSGFLTRRLPGIGGRPGPSFIATARSF
jgi:hypothetical protein